MTKIDMTTDEIWDVLYEQLKPDIPFNRAKTVKQVLEELNAKNPDSKVKITENYVRENLERKVREEGWTKKKFRSTVYFWPPD